MFKDVCNSFWELLDEIAFLTCLFNFSKKDVLLKHKIDGNKSSYNELYNSVISFINIFALEDKLLFCFGCENIFFS